MYSVIMALKWDLHIDVMDGAMEFCMGLDENSFVKS
jgi:hypothetical protein